MEKEEGPNAAALFSAASRRTALLHIQETLRLMPENDAFMEAMRRAPHLVYLESDPINFLRHAEFNVWNAARRLAFFWSQRKEIFEERAFLPMTLTGEGALDKEDVAAYRKGYHQILPNHTSGLSVVWCDRGGFHSLSLKERRRCIFYTWTLVSESINAVENGVIGVGIMDKMFVDETCKENAALILNAFPISINAVHIFCVPTAGFTKKLGLQLTKMLINLLGSSVFQNTKLYLNLAPEDRKAKMLSLGFRAEGIPVVVGGLRDQAALDSWINERQAFESEKYLDQPLLSQDAREDLDSKMSATAFAVNPGAPTFAQQGPLLPSSQRYHRQPMESPYTAVAIRTRDKVPEQPPQASHLSMFDTIAKDQKMRPMHPLLTKQQLAAAAATGAAHSADVASAKCSTDRAHTKGSVNSSPELLDTKPPARDTSLDEKKRDDDEYTRLGLDSNNLPEETEDMRQSGRHAIKEALAVIPDSHKAAYLEAAERAPHLVTSESDSARFLRCSDYDVSTASKRLVAYWDLRKKLFGERAFLPMTQTGSGALTHDDVVVLSSGSAAILPHDAKNRNVVITDRSRTLDSISVAFDSKIRCFFYLMSVLAENELSQTDGYVFLGVLITPRVGEFYDDFADKCLEIQRVIPARLKAFHLLVCPPKAGNKPLVDKIVSTALTKAREVHGKRALIHSASSYEELFKKLEKFGLSKEGLPPYAGGRWMYEEFTHWQRDRRRLEQAAQTDVEARDDQQSDGASSMNLYEDVNARRERKRKLNIIHSRQKRERRRSEALRLQEACNALREKNRAVQQENASLETILRDANAKAAELDRRAIAMVNVLGARTVAAVSLDPWGAGATSSAAAGHLPRRGMAAFPSIDYQQQQQQQQDMQFSSQLGVMQELIAVERLNQERVLRQEALARAFLYSVAARESQQQALQHAIRNFSSGSSLQGSAISQQRDRLNAFSGLDQLMYSSSGLTHHQSRPILPSSLSVPYPPWENEANRSAAAFLLQQQDEELQQQQGLLQQFQQRHYDPTNPNNFHPPYHPHRDHP